MLQRNAILIGMTLITCFTGKALAVEAGCRTSPQLVGQCFVVHGRLSAGNGNPIFRIWPTGTKRMLGVNQSTHGSLDDPRDFPPEIRRFIPADVWNMPYLYGDYTVCPFTHEHPGWMQYVCIAAAMHLVSVPLDPAPPERKNFDAKP